jgi:two-component system sensor kinase FixL
MSLLSTIWLVIASACLTLAAVHGHVWLRERSLAANAAFAALAASVAAMAYFELRMFQSESTAEYGRMLWWYHLPVWSGLVSMVFFVRLYLRTGRAWLGWTAIGLRTVALLVNFVSSPNINFHEITSLERIRLLGADLAIPKGETNPLLAIAQVSLLVLILFVADAAWTAWRAGARRRALVIGGGFVVFIAVAGVMAVLSYWGLASVPVAATFFFLPIVLAMGYELGLELIRSVRLAVELEAKTTELRGSEQKLSFAAEAASAGLWSVEPRTGRLWGTPKALSMFGLAPGHEHQIGQVLASIHPDDRERFRAFVQGSHDYRAALEYRSIQPDGTIRWHATRGGKHDDGEAGQSLMGATVDITERKRAEDEVARQRVELEHLSRVAALNEMSGTLAHELNQPLAIIMSNAEAAQALLERPVLDLDEVRAILDDIVAADARAGEVIKRLRRMLKREEPARHSLSINDVVQGVLQFMRAELVRRGIALETALAESLPDVLADRVAIEQVLVNLINNACDAMNGNLPGDRGLKVVTAADDGMVCALIVDAGTGLPTQPDRVFDAFYTTKRSGLGMGLAISRSILSAHGGRLSAESNPERGATFTVCLPVAGTPA